jgi:hypothetical protein
MQAFCECCTALNLTGFRPPLAEEASVAADVEITSGETGSHVRLGLLFGMEWWIHLKKALKGSMELHFMKELTDGKHVFVGTRNNMLMVVAAATCSLSCSMLLGDKACLQHCALLV